MARKNSKSQATKSKEKKAKGKKVKKEITIAPRLRLEPRLTSSPLKKRKNSQNQEVEKQYFVDLASIPVLDTSTQDSFVEDSSEQKNEAPDTSTLSASRKNMSYQMQSNMSETSENAEKEEQSCKTPDKPPVVKKKWKPLTIQKGLSWTDRERMDLGIALQVHGFADIKKLSECVKTKNENNIALFLKRRRIEACYDPVRDKIKNRQGNKFNSLIPHHLAQWPNIRKWRRLAHKQMMRHARSIDYSKPVLTALCKKFHDEEREPTDPQVLNVKLIYKYMMNCMEGEVPPQLPPKESALVLDLLREVRLMPIAYDFEEERKFLRDFRTSTKFRPFQVKDEFKKHIKKEPQEEDMFPPNTVQVPEQVFMELSRHKRLTQSFSPLVTPVWMLQKEQEMLAKYASESNVYVD